MGLSAYAVCLLLGFGFGWVAGSRRTVEVAQADDSKPADAPKPVEIKPPDNAPADRVAPKEKSPPPKKEPPKWEPPKAEPPKREPPKAEVPKTPEPKREPPKTEPAPATNVTFTKDIVPVFRSHCLTCHGIPSIKGGLDVRTLAAIMKGGDSGDAIKPGDPANSLLWKQIEDGEMPPAGKPRLTDAEKKLIKDWIAGGAK
jgi:hypothetical protein